MKKIFIYINNFNNILKYITIINKLKRDLLRFGKCIIDIIKTNLINIIHFYFYINTRFVEESIILHLKKGFSFKRLYL